MKSSLNAAKIHFTTSMQSLIRKARKSTGRPGNGMLYRSLYVITSIKYYDPNFGRITRNKLIRNNLTWSLLYSFLCVSGEFQPISTSFIPVRSQGMKKRKHGDRGERPILITVDYFLKYRFDSHFASAKVHTDAISIFSCRANGNSGFP